MFMRGKHKCVNINKIQKENIKLQNMMHTMIYEYGVFNYGKRKKKFILTFVWNKPYVNRYTFVLCQS